MRFSWQNRTGLAKAAAIFASTLTISLGLCGANFFAFARWGNYETNRAPWWPSTFLVYTGLAELLGILVGGMGLLIVAFLALAERVQARFSTGHDNEGRD